MLTGRSPFDRSRLIKQSGTEQESRRSTEVIGVRGNDKRDFKTPVLNLVSNLIAMRDSTSW